MNECQAFDSFLARFFRKLDSCLIALHCFRGVIYGSVRVGDFHEHSEYDGSLASMVVLMCRDDFQIGTVVPRGGLGFTALVQELCEIKLGVGLLRVDLDGAPPAIERFVFMTLPMSQQAIVHQRIGIARESPKNLLVQRVSFGVAPSLDQATAVSFLQR